MDWTVIVNHLDASKLDILSGRLQEALLYSYHTAVLVLNSSTKQLYLYLYYKKLWYLQIAKKVATVKNFKIVCLPVLKIELW